MLECIDIGYSIGYSVQKMVSFFLCLEEIQNARDTR